jgi:signal transduction histidine kinase
MLRITAHPDQADSVRIGVEDTGKGFDPATADQIFAPFYTTKSTGMGMGLAIYKTIVEAHGGQLWASPSRMASFSSSVCRPTAVPRINEQFSQAASGFDFCCKRIGFCTKSYFKKSLFRATDLRWHQSGSGTEKQAVPS